MSFLPNRLFFINMKTKNKAILYALAFFRSCPLATSLTMSITNLLILAILRFYAVTRPFKYMTITKKFLAKIWILQWVLITLSAVFHFAFSYRINDNNSVSLDNRIVYYLITPLSYYCYYCLCCYLFLYF